MTATIIFVIVYALILIFAISYLVGTIMSWYVTSKKKKDFQKDILNPLKKAVDSGNLKTIKDIYSIVRNSNIKPYSNNPDEHIEDILYALHTYILTEKSSGSKDFDIKSNLIDSLFKEFEKNNEKKPFDGLSDVEKGIMLDVMALVNISKEHSSLLKSKLDTLTKILKTKERDIQEIGADSKKSFRLSIISLLVGIISLIISIFSMLNDIFKFL